MTEQTSHYETYHVKTEDGKNRFLQRAVEMERELMKMKRAERVLREMEQRCRPLMDSGVFLCAVLAADGRFRVMNRRAEEFFGFQAKTAADVTLQSLSGPGHAAEVEHMLKEAASGSVHAALPVACPDGAVRWLDMEYSPTIHQGEASIQIIASEITGLVSVSASAVPDSPNLQNSPQTSGFSQIEFMNAIPGMFFVVDDDSRCVEANTAFLNVMKLPRDAVIGRRFGEFLLEGDAANENMTADFAGAVRKESFENLECKVVSKDRDVLYLGLCGTRIQLEGKPRTLVSCTDNTKLRRTEEQLRRASTTDVSTGILNRQGMERVLSAEIERAARYKGSLSMIMLDIDGFRRLNERIGYSTSDKVLRRLADALKQRIHLTDFLGRWGGDEFMVLTPAALTTAAQLAEKLRDMVQHMPFAEDHANHLTLSAGVAEFCQPMDISSFVGSAYDAMVEAKKGGGNRVTPAKEPATQPNEA